MELPLPDYDQLPLNELRHRIGALDEGQLRRLFEHEEAHGNRIPVLELLHAPLRELTHGAEPSPADPAKTPGAAPTPHDPPAKGSTAPEPGAPLRQGVAAQTPRRART